MKLRILHEKLTDLGLDPDKTLQSQLRDLEWYNWIRRSRLKALQEDLYGVHRQLGSFIDDATALMLCEGGGKMGKTEMFEEAYKRKRELDAVVFDPDRSLGKILEQLLASASKVNEELRVA